jgi:hypothetical protein
MADASMLPVNASLDTMAQLVSSKIVQMIAPIMGFVISRLAYASATTSTNLGKTRIVQSFLAIH